MGRIMQDGTYVVATAAAAALTAAATNTTTGAVLPDVNQMIDEFGNRIFVFTVCGCVPQCW